MADPKTNADAKAEMQAAVEAADNFKGERLDVEYDGYKFVVDTGLLDDVGIVDLIDRIERGKSLKAVVEFLHYLVGNEGYEQMEAYFVKKDGRFKLTKLSRVYYAIFEQFDPKD